MGLLIVLLFLAGLVLLWLSGRRQAKAGLPAGRLVYIDDWDLSRRGQPLYDARLGLAGRPDYLLHGPDGLIPVEVKSSEAPVRPYVSHILQLAAYCLLVETSLGARPDYGILKYADHAFAVDYTPAVENELLGTLARMRTTGKREPGRSHEAPQRCRRCGYREVCNQRLV